MIDLEKLEKILELMSRYGVDVVQAESAKERFAVARNAPQAHFFAQPQATNAGAAVAAGMAMAPSQGFAAESGQTAAAPASQGGPDSARPATQSAVKPVPAEEGKVQRSELVGTFYRAASPTSTPFADVGKKVRKGQTLCIVEAMKIMNEIESEWDGEILEILVENGKPVEFGTPLFRIRPS